MRYPFLFILLLLKQSLLIGQHLVDNQKTMDSLVFDQNIAARIDTTALHAGLVAIINEALDSAAFPGCQMLLAKDGEIFYYQSFGYHTYDSIRKVQNTDIYDLASITKVTAATLALMKLYDDGLLDLDQSMGYYFPYLSKSNKANLSLRKVLAHQSGLKSWIPYYAASQRKNGRYKRRTIAKDSSFAYPYNIPGSDLYLHKDFKEDRIYKMIRKSKLYKQEEYVYSGLAFYLFPDLVERLSGLSFEDYLNQNFYEPLEASTLGFVPMRKFSPDQVVPTEIDTFFRMNKLHGVVHDEGAATMLGISGNAGLFSNASDLAKVFQMLLNGGIYQNRQYLTSETINEFTRCQYCDLDNRRGLGFDKPLISYDSIKTSVAKLASPNSYGHSGYTGTLVWADPDYDLIFILLTNRVYPTRSNRKIYQLNVRPRIHDLVYYLIEKKEKKSE